MRCRSGRRGHVQHAEVPRHVVLVVAPFAVPADHDPKKIRVGFDPSRLEREDDLRGLAPKRLDASQPVAREYLQAVMLDQAAQVAAGRMADAGQSRAGFGMLPAEDRLALPYRPELAVRIGLLQLEKDDFDLRDAQPSPRVADLCVELARAHRPIA